MITTDDEKKIYVTPLDHQIEMGGNHNDENIVSGHTRSPNGNKWRVNSDRTGLQNINQIDFSINKTVAEIKEFNQMERKTDGGKIQENLNKENDLRRILVRVSEEDERGGSTNIAGVLNRKSNYLKVEPDSINSVDSRVYSYNNPLPEINRFHTNFHRFPYFQQHFHHHPQPTYSLNPPYFDSNLSQEGNGNKIQLGYDKFLQSKNNYKFGIYERHRPPDPMLQVLLSHYGRYLPLTGDLREYGFYSYSAGNDYHNNLPSGGYKVVEDYD